MKKNAVKLFYQSCIVAIAYLFNTIYEAELLVVIIAIILVGYKISLKNKQLIYKLKEIAPIIIGTIIVEIGSITTRFFINFNFKSFFIMIKNNAINIAQIFSASIAILATFLVIFALFFRYQYLKNYFLVFTFTLIVYLVTITLEFFRI